MTQTATDERASTNGSGGGSRGGDGSSSLLDALPTDRLKDAGRELLGAVVQRAVDAALDRVDDLTGKLTDVAGNGGVGLSSVLGGGASAMAGNNPVTGALSSGFSAVKDKVTGALGMGGGDDSEGSDSQGSDSGGGGGGTGGGRGKFKFMNIFEAQDVGVPLRVVYDQWTQFADFPSFMKKVETVDQESDEKINWKAQVFWSHRSWETTIVEQIPDTHIIWTSTGAKGHADGCVTFHELAPNMTRIILILEYYPQGFFEKTGNLWRAVGRRARLEFKHFCRHVMMDTLLNQDELEGWRGEIRDSEVVKTHEEAMQEEQEAAEQQEGEEEAPADELESGEDEEAAEDTESTEAEDRDEDTEGEEQPEDEYEDTEDEYEDTEDEYEDGEAEDEYEEPEPEPEPERQRSRRPRRRQPAQA